MWLKKRHKSSHAHFSQVPKLSPTGKLSVTWSHMCPEAFNTVALAQATHPPFNWPSPAHHERRQSWGWHFHTKERDSFTSDSSLHPASRVMTKNNHFQHLQSQLPWWRQIRSYQSLAFLHSWSDLGTGIPDHITRKASGRKSPGSTSEQQQQRAQNLCSRGRRHRHLQLFAILGCSRAAAKIASEAAGTGRFLYELHRCLQRWK